MPEHDVDSLQPEIAFRPLNAEDLPFLHDSWGSSVYRGTTAHFHLTPGEFHSFHRAARERFFQKPTTTVIVACPTADPWLIAGWIAVEQLASGLILQFVYVKSAFKGQGLGTALIRNALPSYPVFYTSRTQTAAKIIARNPGKYSGFIYVPHLL